MMFLHIGANVLIDVRKVIVIYDIQDQKNDRFLATMREQKKIRDVSEQMPKSCIIADDCIYLSSISVVTLQNRFQISQKLWQNE